MFGAILLLSLSCLVNLTIGQQCAFPDGTVLPCRCYHRQVSCRGQRITDTVLSAVFRNLSTHLPHYQQHIESLELIDSNVNSITPTVFGTVQIRSYLKMRNNRLTNFSIATLDQLFMVDVSNNHFTTELPPDSFIGLKQLQVLHAANVGLKTLKKPYFSHLKNLRRLDLSGNGIELVEVGAFTSEYDNNFELRDINLSHNRIRRLPENIFLVLRQPEHINLADNRLEKVDEIFKFNRDMVQFSPVQIILSNNSLRNDHFTADTFKHLLARQHYIELDLSHNKLAWVSEAAFGKLLHEDSRNVVRLNHNLIGCTNCRNRWLIERAAANPNFLKSISLDNCIENRQFADLKLSDFKHCN